MQTPAPHSSIVERVVAAVAAVGATTALFAAVVAIAEPQRSELMALNAVRHAQPQATIVAAVNGPAAKACRATDAAQHQDCTPTIQPTP